MNYEYIVNYYPSYNIMKTHNLRSKSIYLLKMLDKCICF